MTKVSLAQLLLLSSLCCMSHCLLVFSVSVNIAAEGRALCETARAFTAAGVKIRRWDNSIGQYVYTGVFGPSSGYELKNWRLGYSAANSTCAHNTSLPLYQPDWCSSWDGVGCDWTTKRVTRLDINAYDWTKTSHIPTAIGALTSLQRLSLSNIGLAESRVPTFVGALTNMQYLQLSSMGLTGSIPNFAGLTRLNTLYLDNNMLTGVVPAFVNRTMTSSYWNWNFYSSCNLTSTIPKIVNRIYSQGRCKSNKGEPDISGAFIVCLLAAHLIFFFSYFLPCFRYPQRPLWRMGAPSAR